MKLGVLWWRQEIGHRYKYDESHCLYICQWCGTHNKRDAKGRRLMLNKAVRICIDRQAVLFSPVRASSSRDTLGWSPPQYWKR